MKHIIIIIALIIVSISISIIAIIIVHCSCKSDQGGQIQFNSFVVAEQAYFFKEEFNVFEFF